MVLKLGSQGNDVKQLQNNLNTLNFPCGNADGAFGIKTQNSVIAFQKAYKLIIDGVAGEQTQTAIQKALTTKQTNLLKFGTVNTNVGVLQTKLNTLGYSCGAVDNMFGKQTDTAVRNFQRDNSLVVDGIVGSITLGVLEQKYNEKMNKKSIIVPTLIPNQTHEIKIVDFPNHLDQVPNRNITNFIVQHNIGGIMKFLDVNQLHLNNGWASIGYHFYIDLDGTIYQGRPINKVPAACFGLNDQSVNIVCNGNFDNQQPTEAQLASITWLVQYIRSIYGDIKYIGHLDAKSIISWSTPTGCPGSQFPLQTMKNKFN